jgi:hypothetical protein
VALLGLPFGSSGIVFEVVLPNQLERATYDEGENKEAGKRRSRTDPSDGGGAEHIGLERLDVDVGQRTARRVAIEKIIVLERAEARARIKMKE